MDFPLPLYLLPSRGNEAATRKQIEKKAPSSGLFLSPATRAELHVAVFLFCSAHARLLIALFHGITIL